MSFRAFARKLFGRNKDAQALQVFASLSDAEAVHTIRHYVYVSTSELAGEVGATLRKRGFAVEENLGADGKNWLVLAQHEAVPTDELLTLIRLSMGELVAPVGGQYDGWEVEIRRGRLH
jgi:hypothetical protein